MSDEKTKLPEGNPVEESGVESLGDALERAKAAVPYLDVTAGAPGAVKWLQDEVGHPEGVLAGIFNRKGVLVHTPRIDEDGYVPLEREDDNEEDSAPGAEKGQDGPAQIRPITRESIRARIEFSYWPFKWVKDEESGKAKRLAALFPSGGCNLPLEAPDLLPNVRMLNGVIHTPIIRADGSLLDTPGYDEATGLLYLPDPGLVIPKVPKIPGPKQVEGAKRFIGEMLSEFKFDSEYDRANYLGALFTPMLRLIAPPPYKFFLVDAPQPGSGKTTLANTIRWVHGGIFKGELPEDNAELRKIVTTILNFTTGPVVIFDNIRGAVKFSTLESLLTNKAWDDRLLGKNEALAGRNDRLWVGTANNARLGGDMPRRTLWCRLNARMSQPQRRIFEKELEPWVMANRGKVIWCLLALIRHWVAEGKPMEPVETGDYSRWTNTVNGILSAAGYDLVFHAPESSRQEISEEDEEWGEFLAAAYRVFGEKTWTTKDLVGAIEEAGALADMVRRDEETEETKELADLRRRHDQHKDRPSQWKELTPEERKRMKRLNEKLKSEAPKPKTKILVDELPADLAETIESPKLTDSTKSKKVGWWLKNRTDKFADFHTDDSETPVESYCVTKASGKNAKSAKWKVVKASLGTTE